MKKTLFLLAAAAAISTACSMDETTEVVAEGLPIDFRTAVATRTTESAMNTEANLKKINVTAIDEKGNNYFSNQDFTKEDVTFTNGNDYPWPEGNLTFYAYAPTPLTSVSEGVNITNGNKTVKFTVQKDISKQEDFITAMATGSKADDVNGMPLNFGHRLSQIEIQAKVAADATKFSYTISGVRIANVKNSGTFDFDSDAWSAQGGNATYEAVCDEVSLTTGEQSIMGDENGNAMLIPQTIENIWNGEGKQANPGAYLAVNIKIVEKKAGTVESEESIYKGWAAVPFNETTTWEAGKKYIYTLTFTDTAAGKTEPTEDGGGEEILDENYIDFNVTVSEEWEEATTQLLGGE